MKAIHTKFLPATNVRGARIKASAEGVKSLTISYPHEFNSEDAHRVAAEMLATRQGWKGDFSGGGLPNGDCAWTFASTAKPRTNPKRRAWTESNTQIATWFERDRQHVELSDAKGRTILEWWDEGVSEAVEDGFLNPRDWHGSAVEYANSIGAKVATRKNPVARKRVGVPRKKYVNRASQITGRPPTTRLRKRRATMALMRERGFTGAFPNPDPSHSLYVQIMRNGKWHDVDGYGSEVVARAVAEVFGKAGYTARVVRK